MTIDVRGMNLPLSPAMENHAKQRLLSALGRFQGSIRRVLVRIGDLNGPKGGQAMRCQATVEFSGPGAIVVDHRSHDVYHGVDGLANRLKQAVRRGLERRRAPRA